MNKTQENKKTYQPIRCSLVELDTEDVVTASADPTEVDTIKFDRAWLD